MFKKELIIKGVLEYDDKHGIDDCFSVSPFRVPINCKNKNVIKDNILITQDLNTLKIVLKFTKVRTN